MILVVTEFLITDKQFIDENLSNVTEMSSSNIFDQ